MTASWRVRRGFVCVRTMLVAGSLAALAVSDSGAAQATAAAPTVHAHLLTTGAVRANGAAGEVRVTAQCSADVQLSIQVDLHQALPDHHIVEGVGGSESRCRGGSHVYTVELGPFSDHFVSGSAAAVLTVSCATATTTCLVPVTTEQVVYLSGQRDFDLPVAGNGYAPTFRAVIDGRARRERSGKYLDLGARVTCPAGESATSVANLVQEKDGRPLFGLGNPTAVCDGAPHQVTARILIQSEVHPGVAFVDIGWEDCVQAEPVQPCLEVDVFRQIAIS